MCVSNATTIEILTCQRVTKMRVLMVTPGFYPIKGGTETVVRNLSAELNKMGVHANVMTFNMDRKWSPKWRGKVEKLVILLFSKFQH